MNQLQKLEPTIIWKYFEEICKIPRPSKKEEKIRNYLLKFGKELNLETKRDEIGNVLISKPASPEYENLRPVLLQSHIDMVCEKNSDLDFNFEVDPIQPFIEGEWIKAKGTTLGADNGIGIAAQLALLSDNTIKHGPIECLFTVDEETGLTGAFNLQPGFFKSKILINLDSEDEGELFIGSAGGIDTLITLPCKRKKAPANGLVYEINISGLSGGHSGDDIHRFRGNSIKILNRILWSVRQEEKYFLNTMSGGNLRNAIPREAKAVVVVVEKSAKAFLDLFHKQVAIIEAEHKQNEPGLKILIEPVAEPVQSVLTNKSIKKLLNGLYACPHGIVAMSKDIPGLVETSTNLASIKFIDPSTIEITTSQRSSADSSKINIANQVRSVFNLAGAAIKHTDGYPGWTPDTDSEILRITEKSYTGLFKEKPAVRAIHAGLECGLFLEKYPDLDMISFGPTIKGAHSPDERIHIKSTEKFWKLLLDVLQNIPKN
ncbi:MAG: aminoacyl-histidine dipeptidase [Bacteroidales bacterium]|nr:aminoacyl-histidine dipeptidase [Bacteroidales bacterium]